MDEQCSTPWRHVEGARCVWTTNGRLKKGQQQKRYGSSFRAKSIHKLPAKPVSQTSYTMTRCGAGYLRSFGRLCAKWVSTLQQRCETWSTSACIAIAVCNSVWLLAFATMMRRQSSSIRSLFRHTTHIFHYLTCLTGHWYAKKAKIIHQLIWTLLDVKSLRLGYFFAKTAKIKR